MKKKNEMKIKRINETAVSSPVRNSFFFPRASVRACGWVFAFFAWKDKAAVGPCYGTVTALSRQLGREGFVEYSQHISCCCMEGVLLRRGGGEVSKNQVSWRAALLSTSDGSNPDGSNPDLSLGRVHVPSRFSALTTAFRTATSTYTTMNIVVSSEAKRRCLSTNNSFHCENTGRPAPPRPSLELLVPYHIIAPVALHTHLPVPALRTAVLCFSFLPSLSTAERCFARFCHDSAVYLPYSACRRYCTSTIFYRMKK